MEYQRQGIVHSKRKYFFLQLMYMVIGFLVVSTLASCSIIGPRVLQEEGNQTRLIDDIISERANIVLSDEREKGIVGFFISLHKSLMFNLLTFSSDTVFITDPFFATNYLGSSDRKKWADFYENALLMGDRDARIMVIQEPENQETHKIRVGNLFQSVSLLSSSDYFYIKHAKRVVVSPLLESLAPQQYTIIKQLREAEGLEIEKIAFNAPMNSEKYITFDYTQAMYDLGVWAAELAQQRTPRAPKVYLILDLNDIRSITDQTNVFLEGLYHENEDIEVLYKWRRRTAKNSIVTKEDIVGAPDDAIIVLNAGLHSYSAISEYMEENIDNIAFWKDRFLMVSGLWPEVKDYQIPLAAKVYIPKDFIFKKTHTINAVFSRIERSEDNKN